MNSTIFHNAVRLIALVLLQGLLLRRIAMEWPYFHIVLYPLAIMLLPLRMPNTLVITLGFACGLLVDIFYQTPGLHASAGTWTAFVRAFVLRYLEPRGAGYNVNYSPTAWRMGLGWFLRYAAILMWLHLFFLFSVEAFTFVFIGEILLKTTLSFTLSMLFVFIYTVVFNPIE